MICFWQWAHVAVLNGQLLEGLCSQAGSTDLMLSFCKASMASKLLPALQARHVHVPFISSPELCTALESIHDAA